MTTEKRTPHNTDHPYAGNFCARCKAVGYTDAKKAAAWKAAAAKKKGGSDE